MCVIDAPILTRGRKMATEEILYELFTYGTLYTILLHGINSCSGEVEKQGSVVINK